MTDKEFYIGNKDDYQKYITDHSVCNLPVKNLPMSYFPFFYNTNESSIAKMKRLVPLIENYTKKYGETSDCQVTAAYTIDTEQLFGLLSSLEEPYQPFNKNNATHIMIAITLVWGIVALGVLRVISMIWNERYIYFILGCILTLLIFGVIWALFITNTVI
jgi:hypothetical protein